MFFEEWKLWGGNRLKSVIIVVLAVAVIAGWCPGESVESVSDAVVFQSDTIEENQSEYLADDQMEQRQDVYLQIQIAGYEQEFQEAMKLLGEDNLLSARYVMEAEELYLEYAEAMSWATAYREYDPEAQNIQRGDILLMKGKHKAELLKLQIDWMYDFGLAE